MNLGNGFIPWVTWKTTMCGVWIWLFQVFWWTPVNIWDQLRHMALVFVALFFFGAHHPLSRKRREDILDTSETNLELPQQQMPGAWSGNKRCLYPLQGWLCWLVLGDMKISCPRDEGWYIFGSKVLCFLLGEETDSSIREFHWLSFSYFFWPFDRLKPTILQNCLRFFSIDTMWNLKTFGSYLNNFSQRPTSKKPNAVQGACFLFWATLVIKKSKW